MISVLASLCRVLANPCSHIYSYAVIAIIHCFTLVVVTVKFRNERYTVNEDDGIVQPLLVLSSPSSFVETVQMINTDVTANGEVVSYCKLCLTLYCYRK